MSTEDLEKPNQPGVDNREASLQTPESEPRVDDSHVKQLAADTIAEIQQEAADIVPKAEGQIESAAASMHIPPETIEITREQIGLDAQLAGVQTEAGELVGDAKQEIQEVMDKQVEVTLQDTELGFSGEIIINGESLGHFSIWKVDDKKAYIHNIQIGYDENAPRDKGYGFEAYKKIIGLLKERGIKLVSTDFSISNTSLSPQALRVWEKLFAAGYATKVGEVEAKIYNRFGKSEEEFRFIPKYESVI